MLVVELGLSVLTSDAVYVLVRGGQFKH